MAVVCAIAIACEFSIHGTILTSVSLNTMHRGNPPLDLIPWNVGFQRGNKNVMRILFVAAEAAPLAKVGGMGDVVGTLPKILRAMGHDVRIFMPYYGLIAKKMSVPEKPVWSGDAISTPFEVFETVLPKSDVPLYLFGHPAFAIDAIYGTEDEAWRFTFFANGAAEFCTSYWQPDIIHCHDWHTGMLPVLMHKTPEISTVFTIHNLAYQGPARWQLEQIAKCPWYMQGDTTMSSALLYADRVNAVSPTYAQQIQTKEYGENLEGLLSYISKKLTGIVNGIDLDDFDPATDKNIAQTFTRETLEKRAINKQTLQQEMGLEVNDERFVIGLVSRLVEQKGIDLILQTMDRFLSYSNAQLVLLGSGERQYETQLWELSNRFPGRASVYLMYSSQLAQKIYAGADAFLMPSRFEPCGISQMIAMRYGCIPIVRHTGGLVDTVSDHDPGKGTGTGYCFERYEPLDLFACMVRAWEGFKYKESWRELQKRAMAENFSWEKSAIEYIKLYSDIKGISPVGQTPVKYGGTLKV